LFVFFLLYLNSVNLVCLYYLAKCVASQAVSNDAYVEELRSIVVYLHKDQLHEDA